MSDVESRDAAALVGRRLGEFVVREALSSGGFGMVFRAEQPALSRAAVIKVLHLRLRASEKVIQRFLREAQLASRLDHPYAAHIYAFGAEPDGLMWIAMELVRGTPLDRLLEAKGPVSLERFVPLLERICQVVQTAHEQGIVHRDIKPGNVMVLVRAGQLLPKLLDLGIAKLDQAPSATTSMPVAIAPAEPARVPTPAPVVLGGVPGGVAATMMAAVAPMPAPLARLAETAPPDAPDAATTVGKLTEDGAVMGSPLYMAPEQWTDAGAVDARTDIYALGVMSYEALTGRTPFVGQNLMMIATAHAQQTPPPLGGSFPTALDAVIARAMAKRPADRFGSALEMAAAFRAASGVAEEPVGLPRIDDAIRIPALANAPQPIAQAVAALDGARNVHQARDAVWRLVRVAARLAGVIALAGQSHLRTGTGGILNEGTVTEALRRLRHRALPDADWLALAKELCAPFAHVRAAYPIPELLDFLDQPTLGELIALHDADAGTSAREVGEVLERAVPLAGQLLAALAFLGDYQLVVRAASGLQRWMGVGAIEPVRGEVRGPALDLAQPAFVDATGVPVISLWPFVQVLEPAPGVAPCLFFLEGKGRRGARLVALPETFELEDESLWEVAGALVGDASELGRISDEEVCPYPGLAAFTANDATRFFGRERETEAFVNRLRAQPLLAVVGPSGAGKSSFVQAGVVPALPDDWHVVTLRPGPTPMLSLTARLAHLVDPGVLRADLARDPDELGVLLRSRTSSGVTLINVDQLEELFTLCDDAGERERFMSVLVRAARSPDDPVRVVFTLRDDFLLHAESLPSLRSRLAPALHLLTTPSPEALQRILLEPLRLAGYELDDPTLAAEMVGALRDTRSALALLSFTCSKLWELRDRRFRQISRKAYTSLGGVGGALAQHAENTLTAMVPEEQRLVREVFRHAVTADGTRAVLGRAELDEVVGGGTYARTVVDKLIAARLLVTAESATGGEEVEITHEALIGAWPRLVTWRREDAEGARLRGQLRTAARQWDERNRAAGLLWRGDALAEYRLWRARYPGTLAAVEAAFADASLTEAARASRRLRLVIASAISILAIGVVALLIQNARVDSQRVAAQDSEKAAQESKVAAQDSEAAAQSSKDRVIATLREQYENQGRRLIALEDDPVQGLAYLAEAAKLGAGGTAHDLLVAFAARIVASKQLRVTHDNLVYRARFSPDGQRFVTSGLDARARVWDAATGKLIAEMVNDAPVTRVELSRDGNTVITGSHDGSALWDATTGKRRFALRHDRSVVQAAILSPDGAWAVTVENDDVVELWDATSGGLRATLQPEATPNPVGALHFGTPAAFSPDGHLIAVGDARGVVRIWDVATASLVATNANHHDLINALVFFPDGKRIAVASNDNTASVIDVTTGARVTRVAHESAVNAIDVSSDGKWFATASNDHTAVVWRADGGVVQRLVGHDAGVNAIAFRPDGVQVATGADDKTAALWDIATGRRDARLVGHDAEVLDVRYDASGRHLVTAADSSAILWTTASQQPRRRFIGHHGVVTSAAFSVAGDRIVTSGEDGTARVWDPETGREIFAVHQQGLVRRAAFSSDGTMIASGGDDRVIHVWDAASGATAATLRGHDGSISDLAWRPNTRQLVSTSRDGTARVWTVGEPDASLVYRGHGDVQVSSVAFAPAGDSVLTTGDDRTLRWWNIRDGADVAQWKSDKDLVQASFNPAGDRVAGETGAAATVWRTEPRGSLATNTVAELGGSAYSVRWSPDGKLLITASLDGGTRIHDPRTGDVLVVLAADDRAQVWSAQFSPDGRSVVSTQSDGIAVMWELPAPPADLERLMRCEVPFELRDNRMVHAVRPPCTSKIK